MNGSLSFWRGGCKKDQRRNHIWSLKTGLPKGNEDTPEAWEIQLIMRNSVDRLRKEWFVLPQYLGEQVEKGRLS